MAYISVKFLKENLILKYFVIFLSNFLLGNPYIFCHVQFSRITMLLDI